MYTVTLTVLGRKTTATGESVIEALTNLKPTGKAAGKAVISFEHNKIKKERVLTAAQVSRLFNLSSLMREVAIKNLSLMFDGL